MPLKLGFLVSQSSTMHRIRRRSTRARPPPHRGEVDVDPAPSPGPVKERRVNDPVADSESQPGYSTARQLHRRLDAAAEVIVSKENGIGARRYA